MSSAVVPQHAEIPAPAIEEVSKGIYAYIQLDGSWFLNNAGCIVGEKTATVIDSTGTEARARAWHAAIRQVTQNPVSSLINTHSHGDHTYGNFMFADSAIIASERCRREIIASGNGSHSLFPMIDFGDCPVTPPTVTFEDKLSVYVDDLRVELMFVGPAHTTNDIVAWIPERKLLFSGDVIFNGGTPFALAGSVGGWLEALERIEALGAETIVPGHGAVTGPGAIQDVRDYLLFIQETAKRGMEAGTPPSGAGPVARPWEVRTAARQGTARAEPAPGIFGAARRTLGRRPRLPADVHRDAGVQREPAVAVFRVASLDS